MKGWAECPPIDALAPVKPYTLRWLFHLRLRSIFGGLGSYSRREKAEQKARERADTVPVLDCQSCGALTPGDRFRYYADQIVCDACVERNPQSRRRLVPRALLQPHSILVKFVGGHSLAVQAMARDTRTMLGPQLRIQSAQTLRRLLGYLGATSDRLADFDISHRSWGQGTVQITLQPGRKNLLKINYQRLWTI